MGPERLEGDCHGSNQGRVEGAGLPASKPAAPRAPGVWDPSVSVRRLDPFSFWSCKRVSVALARAGEASGCLWSTGHPAPGQLHPQNRPHGKGHWAHSVLACEPTSALWPYYWAISPDLGPRCFVSPKQEKRRCWGPKGGSP